MKRAVIAVAALVAILALPSVASARTYQAYAGEPIAPPSTAPPGTSLNAFFPKRLTVRKGDSVNYTNRAFHTVSILGRNVARPPLAIPDPAGGTYTGLTAPNGSPFYFDGLPRFLYNPAVFGPVGTLNVNDRKTHSTGAYFPSAAGPGVKKLKYSRPGTYQVLCLLHPGMKQTVKVVKKRKRADKPAAVTKRVASQSTALFAEATKAAADQPAANEVYVGTESKQATLLAFTPGNITVAAGTTVTFTNDSPSEPHNMIFVGALQPDGKGLAEAFAEQHTAVAEPGGAGAPGGQVAPGYIYGSQPPGGDGIYTYTGTEFGDGFFWSPLTDDQPGDPPTGLVGSEKITFTTAGTYRYYCGIHGTAMAGTVTVQ